MFLTPTARATVREFGRLQHFARDIYLQDLSGIDHRKPVGEKVRFAQIVSDEHNGNLDLSVQAEKLITECHAGGASMR